MNPRFIHLRIHSEYSLVDGVVRIKPLVKILADQNVPAVALTDQSNLFAMVKFYRAAMSMGIKPIVGVDVWVKSEKTNEAPFKCYSVNFKGLSGRSEQWGTHA